MKRLSLLAAVGASCSLALFPAAGSLTAAAAATAPASYNGTPGSAQRLTQTASVQLAESVLGLPQ